MPPSGESFLAEDHIVGRRLVGNTLERSECDTITWLELPGSDHTAGRPEGMVGGSLDLVSRLGDHAENGGPRFLAEPEIYAGRRRVGRLQVEAGQFGPLPFSGHLPDWPCEAVAV